MADTTTDHFDYEQQQKTIEKYAPLMGDVGSAVKTTLETPAGVWDDAKFKEVVDYYSKPTLEASQERLSALTQRFRQSGWTDSGMHGEKLLQEVGQTERDIAQNIAVPMMVEQMTRRGEETRANLSLASQLAGQQLSAYQSQYQLELQAQAQKFDEGMKRAEQTGLIDMPELNASNLGVNLEGMLQSAYQEWIGQFGQLPSDNAKSAIQAQIREKAAQQVRDSAPWLTETQVEAVLNGQTVMGYMPTLQAQSLELEKQKAASAEMLGVAELTGEMPDGSVTLAGRDMNLKETNAELEAAIARAQTTGTFTDPQTGLTVDTLQKWQLQLQEASVTGIYQGSPTLQAMMAKWDQTYQEKVTFGNDEAITTTLEDLGFSKEDFYDADGNLDYQKRMENETALRAAFESVTGRAMKAGEIESLLNRGQVATGSRHIYGTNELQLVMQNNAQEWERMQQEGFWYTDQETGEQRRVLGVDERIRDERLYESGYDVVLRDENGTAVKDGYGNVVTQRVEGTMARQDRIQQRQLDLQEAGMNSDEAYRQATFEEENRRYTGYYQVRTIDLKSLGIDYGTVSFASLDDFFTWADGEGAEQAMRIKSILGRNPTLPELQRLSAGQNIAVTDAKGNAVSDYIPGTQSLEQKKIQAQYDLAEMGYANDRALQLAEQTYQKELKAGYFYQTAEGWKWVEGTQDFEKSLLQLQNQLGINAEQAQWMLQEQTRTGYQKIQTITDEQGNVVGTYIVNVEGTQAFQDKLDLRATQLTRDGWTAQAAQQLAQLEAQQALEWGTFRVGSDGKVQWANGRQAQDAAMQDDAQAFEKYLSDTDIASREGMQERALRNEVTLQTMRDDLTKAGWTFESAENAAAYIRSQSVNDVNYLRQTYFDSRRQYYLTAEGLNDEQASAAALDDWNNVKDSFGEPMQLAIEKIRLDAEVQKFDAEARIALRTGLIETAANAAGDVASLIWDSFRPDSKGDQLLNQISSLMESGTLSAANASGVISALASQNGMTLTAAQQAALTADVALQMGKITGVSGAISKTAMAGKYGIDAAGATGGTTALTGGISLTAIAATAAPIVAAAAATYGVYRAYKYITRDKPALEPINQEEAVAEVNDMISNLSLSARETLQNYLHAWGEGTVEGYVKDFSTDEGGFWSGDEERESTEWRQELSMLGSLLQEQSRKDSATATTSIRSLIDSDAFRKDMSALTLSETRLLRETWAALPASVRTSDDITQLTMGQIVDDVRRYGYTANVLGTDDLISTWNSVQPMLQWGADVLTQSDLGKITAVYEGLGSPQLVQRAEGAVLKGDLGSYFGFGGELDKSRLTKILGDSTGKYLESESYQSGDGQFRLLGDLTKAGAIKVKAVSEGWPPGTWEIKFEGLSGESKGKTGKIPVSTNSGTASGEVLKNLVQTYFNGTDDAEVMIATLQSFAGDRTKSIEYSSRPNLPSSILSEGYLSDNARTRLTNSFNSGTLDSVALSVLKADVEKAVRANLPDDLPQPANQASIGRPEQEEAYVKAKVDAAVAWAQGMVNRSVDYSTPGSENPLGPKPEPVAGSTTPTSADGWTPSYEKYKNTSTTASGGGGTTSAGSTGGSTGATTGSTGATGGSGSTTTPVDTGQGSNPTPAGPSAVDNMVSALQGGGLSVGALGAQYPLVHGALQQMGVKMETIEPIIFKLRSGGAITADEKAALDGAGISLQGVTVGSTGDTAGVDHATKVAALADRIKGAKGPLTLSEEEAAMMPEALSQAGLSSGVWDLAQRAMAGEELTQAEADQVKASFPTMTVRVKAADTGADRGAEFNADIATTKGWDPDVATPLTGEAVYDGFYKLMDAIGAEPAGYNPSRTDINRFPNADEILAYLEAAGVVIRNA